MKYPSGDKIERSVKEMLFSRQLEIFRVCCMFYSSRREYIIAFSILHFAFALR